MGNAAMDAAGETPDAEQKLITRIHGTMDKIDRIVGDRNTVSSALAIAPQTQQPVAPWYVWTCVIAAWLATTGAALSLQATWSTNQRVSDLRSDMNAERVSREIMTRWTAQEVTAIRSYITTGKLAPMKPPPVEKKER